MTNNAPDYTENLAFPPQGDWSDTQPKNNTDRTQSSCDMVDKIEKLTTENTKLKDLLKDCYLANQAFIKTFEWLETIITPTQRNICRKTAEGIKKLQSEIDEVLK